MTQKTIKLSDIYMKKKNFDNDFGNNRTINKILATDSTGEVRTTNYIPTDAIRYAEGQGSESLTYIIDQLYGLIESNSEKTLNVPVTYNKTYLDTEYTFVYLTLIGRFVLVEYGIRTKTDTPLPASGNSIYDTWGYIRIGKIDDPDFIPSSGKYFDTGFALTSNYSSDTRLRIGEDGYISIRGSVNKQLNTYGSGIYSFASTYQH